MEERREREEEENEREEHESHTFPPRTPPIYIMELGLLFASPKIQG